MVTDTLTNMPHNDPAQYTVLGWVKREISQSPQNTETFLYKSILSLPFPPDIAYLRQTWNRN